MYSNFLEDLNDRYEELKNFTGDYLSQYNSKKDKLKDDLRDVIDTMKFNKNLSIAKRDAVIAFYGDLTREMFIYEIEYYDKTTDELTNLKNKVSNLPNYTVNFLSKDLKSLERSLEKDEIDKLAKMVVIETDEEEGCILHFNEERDGDYAEHDEDYFYEYICATCDTDCYKDEDNEVEDYKLSHFIHLSEEEIREYAEETIEDSN